MAYFLILKAKPQLLCALVLMSTNSCHDVQSAMEVIHALKYCISKCLQGYCLSSNPLTSVLRIE
ncbi:hypothetical protein M758_5G048300 [Ceratodon purpureus]|uniref:Secreted protein n=1 Tax=Ceratodon purpureus TaxID=3225 RepID=A0A8T0HZG8_CERPU|nr:hypothetical protein KC19_5G049300 [Ceratodon purpureus]KAG0615521.1 hypothetical protein M758_5G048300 [Ceratodon purpureus]